MQSYTEIPSSETLANSLAELLNNDKTALSCSSGSAFPTTDLQIGMLCARTDQNKLYALLDATPTWGLVRDFNLTVAHLEGAAFVGPVTVQTVATADNSTSAASTAFVKAQNYAPQNAAVTFTGLTVSGTQVEIGSTTAAGTPYIDFHSSGNAIDYDVRLIASGGSTSAGAGLLTVNATGGLTCTGDVRGTSDERVKTNWAGLGDNFVERLAATRHGTFDRTDTGQRQVGVGAQSLAEVIPEAVSADEQGMLSVAYGQAALAACVALARELLALKQKFAVPA